MEVQRRRRGPVLFGAFVVVLNAGFLLWTWAILHGPHVEGLAQSGSNLRKCRAAAASSTRFVTGLVIVFWMGADIALGLLSFYVLVGRGLRDENSFFVP